MLSLLQTYKLDVAKMSSMITLIDSGRIEVLSSDLCEFVSLYGSDGDKMQALKLLLDEMVNVYPHHVAGIVSLFDDARISAKALCVLMDRVKSLGNYSVVHILAAFPEEKRAFVFVSVLYKISPMTQSEFESISCHLNQECKDLILSSTIMKKRLIVDLLELLGGLDDFGKLNVVEFFIKSGLEVGHADENPEVISKYFMDPRYASACCAQ